MQRTSTGTRRRPAACAVLACLLIVFVHPPATALPTSISLVSVGPNGEQGSEDDGGGGSSISSDGNRVAFLWGNAGLYPDDPATAAYLYVKELDSGDLSLVVKATSVDDPELSRDGSAVTFSSSDPDVFPSDPATSEDVYVKDLQSGTLVVASTNAGGEKANGPSFQPSLSTDATKVAFGSSATNLHPGDTDSVSDVYAKDLATDDVALVSTSSAGVKANGYSSPARFSTADRIVSADGTKVVFLSEATNLDPADGEPEPDAYVKDVVTGSLTLASTTTEGTKLDGLIEQPTISASGTKVAFRFYPSDLSAGLAPGVYVKDLISGTLVPAGPGGESPALSADGNRVAFHSRAELDPSIDLPGEGFAYDLIYVRDIAARLTAAVSTDAAGLEAQTYSFGPGITDDGTKVVFSSYASNLDPIDQDFDSDVFAKHVPSPFPTAITRPGIHQGNEWILNFGFKYYPDVRFKFAKASDRPIVGDWDGDGTWTVGAVRGNVWNLTNQTPPQTIAHSFTFAKATDRPIVGDWDGDGTMTPGAVRGNTWYLTNDLPPSSISATFAFAKATDRPIVGDWDGDGIWTPGAVRGNTWYLTDELPPASISATFKFGKASDSPITGDWNGDGTFTPGVFRRGPRWFYKPEWFLASRIGGPVDVYFSIYKSRSSDDPLTGDWNGGGGL